MPPPNAESEEAETAEVDAVIVDDSDEYDDIQMREGRGCRRALCGQWTPMHIVVFCLTFVSYALYHASRKTFSNVKASLQVAWLPGNQSLYPKEVWEREGSLFDDAKAAENFLGVLDAVFMFSYSIGLYASGWIGDRIEPRYVLTFGMLGSGITLFLFGTLTEWVHFYNIPYYVIMWILFGLTQACGWPMEVTIMSRWFGKGHRGFVLGLWAACQSVGNILGAYLVSAILYTGYQNAFLLNAALMIAGGFVVFFGLVSDPHDVGILVDEPSEKSEETVPHCHEPISIFGALRLPGVLPYCLSNACLKLTNYAFFFWLPFYLLSRFNWPEAQADAISTWYDVGAVIGSVVGGLVSDWMRARTPTIVFMIFASIFALYGYSEVEKSLVENEVVMTVVGALVGGSYNLIAATVAADLGTQPALAGNDAALSTVTGLIDGSGSFGSGIGQVFIPLIQNSGPKGWTYVFYLFIGMNTLAVILLIPRLITSIRHTYPNLCRRSEETTPLLE